MKDTLHLEQKAQGGRVGKKKKKEDICIEEWSLP